MNEQLAEDYLKAFHELHFTYAKINDMIKCKKNAAGKVTCRVFNNAGTKPLSKPGMSQKAAIKRMHQIDYFKKKGK